MYVLNVCCPLILGSSACVCLYERVGLTNFHEVDMDDLVDILSSHKVQKRPTSDNIDTILCQLAHTELIQQPAYMSACNELPLNISILIICKY